MKLTLREAALRALKERNDTIAERAKETLRLQNAAALTAFKRIFGFEATLEPGGTFLCDELHFRHPYANRWNILVICPNCHEETWSDWFADLGGLGFQLECPVPEPGHPCGNREAPAAKTRPAYEQLALKHLDDFVTGGQPKGLIYALLAVAEAIRGQPSE